ncbi:hypothetical protein DZF91_07555 [Actinomadura logoneensis]|uniref:Pyrrolo-quinoline quinone repeat domain-containing protein n=1 Tax=Actinomadura logoneensis TaxID=2293572 RepID=A0A372JQF8_9ACTN|nr:PQQ-like beta-propeller repeat protein [Actinomadura logoneensis]RFU42262.1 hypothetical protein DZF91_07555 [Actinomadura logoneensis]
MKPTRTNPRTAGGKDGEDEVFSGSIPGADVNSPGFSRRSFLRAAVLAGAAATIGACDLDASVSTKLSGRKPVWKHTFATKDTGFITPGFLSDDQLPYSLAVSDTMLYASFEGRLYAFDTSGRQRWEAPYGQYDASGDYGPTAPRLLDGVLYTVRNDPGGRGTLQALDPATGRLTWHFSPGAYLSPPSASAGRVVVCNSRYLYGLDAATGRQLWRVGGGSQLYLGVPGITGDTACIVGIGGILDAVDTRTGDVRWSRPRDPSAANKFDQHAFITGDDGVFYVRDVYNRLQAVSASDGKVHWTNQDTPQGPNAAVLSGGVLYVAGHGDNAGVLAIDPGTGKTRWRAPVPAPQPVINASPAVADGVVSVTGEGLLFTLDAATGKQRWTARITDSVDTRVPLSGPAAADRLVFVLCKDEAITDDAGNKDGPVDHLYAYRI